MAAGVKEYLEAHICSLSFGTCSKHVIAAEECPSPSVSFKCLPILLLVPTLGYLSGCYLAGSLMECLVV